MFSKEDAFTEIEAALELYNGVMGDEFGLSIDKDSGVITLEKYGDWVEATESVKIVDSRKFKVVEL